MPQIIETYEQLNALKGGECYIDYLTKHDKSHPSLDEIVAIYLYDYSDSYMINISHPEALKLELTSVLTTLSSKYTSFKTKKAITALHLNPTTHHTDIQSATYFATNKDIEVSPTPTPYHHFYRRFPNGPVNKIIPLSNHIKHMDSQRELLNLELTNDCPTMVNALYYLSSQPIGVDNLVEHKKYNQKYNQRDNKLYSMYKYTTATSRPVCTFNGVNLSTLKKDNGERNCIVPLNDMLLEMDYEGFHPRIISKLIQQPLDPSSVHKQMAQMYFGTSTDDNYKKAKELTFQQIYGGIAKEYLHIGFFKKTQEYINALWDLFCTQGYIETEFFKRRITRENHPSLHPQKLFNYYIQAYETEYNMMKVLEIKKLLEGKKTNLVLYTYDAFLFDIDRTDGKELIRDLHALISSDFPIKMSKGNTYGALVSL